MPVSVYIHTHTYTYARISFIASISDVSEVRNVHGSFI